MSKIELSEKNKANVLELFVSIYHEPSVYDDDKLKKLLKIITQDLTDKEERILVLRYGLDGSHMRTLAEVAKEFGIGRERLRQAEAKAIKKLLRPVRRRYIFSIPSEVKEVNVSLDSELKDVNLSLRITACLKRIGVITVNDLLNARYIDLLKTKNLGKKSFQEISEFIRDNIALVD